MDRSGWRSGSCWGSPGEAAGQVGAQDRQNQPAFLPFGEHRAAREGVEILPADRLEDRPPPLAKQRHLLADGNVQQRQKRISLPEQRLRALHLKLDEPSKMIVAARPADLLLGYAKPLA